MSATVTTKEYRRRLETTVKEARNAGIDALVVTAGTDLSYLTGYRALPLERLTCAVLRPDREPVVVVPLLEKLVAEATPVSDLGLEVATWSESQSPYSLVAKLLKGAKKVAVDPQMWVSHLFALQEHLPLVRFSADSIVTRERMRKSKIEIAALREAGAAIDRVHAKVPSLLRAGRTEREVGADIAELILAEGHETVDFVIVASGPNGASPHHEVSDRVIEVGDPVVVDIGGMMPSGYFSDCTRTYAVGEPPAEFLIAYKALRSAQAAAVDHVKPGVTCESVDAAARDVLTVAGLGEAFVHRTGHGIGLSVHEDPYMVAGNRTKVEAGFAFSVEPGFYLQGKFGARIEDIVIATEDGALSCNNCTHDLVVVDA